MYRRTQFGKMNTSSTTYRLNADSRTKKLLIEQLESGVLAGNESPVTVQKSYPLFEAQNRNCFRNCWMPIKRDHSRTY